MKLSDREIATVLAALRYYQRDLVDDGARFEHGDIATNGGKLKPLDEFEIDKLCDHLNFSPTVHAEPSEPVMVCSTCGSADVFSDAFVSVNNPGDVRTYDAKHCERCEGECSIVTRAEFNQRKRASKANRLRK